MGETVHMSHKERDRLVGFEQVQRCLALRLSRLRLSWSRLRPPLLDIGNQKSFTQAELSQLRSVRLKY